jgi:hypothetical protein
MNGFAVSGASDELSHQMEALALRHADEPTARSILAAWLRGHGARREDVPHPRKRQSCPSRHAHSAPRRIAALTRR